MPTKSAGKRSIYITPDYWNKLLALAHQLDAVGYKVRDQRGNLSVSAVIRVLADEKLTTQKLGGEKA